MSAPMATSGIIQMDRQLSHAAQNLDVSAGMADWTYIGQRLDKCLKFVQILFNFCPMLVKIELPFARGSKRRKEVMFLCPWTSVTYTVFVFDQKTHFSNHWGPARIYLCPDR